MAKAIFVLVGIVIVLAFSLLVARKDGFTSPGTLVQLATSHVPTPEDYYYYVNVYPKRVRKDIIDMTGSDPGPLYEPPYIAYP
jgi:hypothetical protein